MRNLLAILLALASATAQQPAGPRSEHRWLQQFVGEWDVTSRDTMAPGAEPVTTTFHESVRAIGKLWIQAERTPESGSSPLRGVSTLGYDPTQKVFVGTWIDGTRTHLWTYRGRLDAGEEVLTLEAVGPRFDDPTKTALYRTVHTMHGPDHRSIRSSVRTADGQWKTFMTADLHRHLETSTATLGAGCFWCIEAVLERVDGITDVRSGYMGGSVDKPTYEQVCTGTTGHAEVVQVTFVPERLPYDELLDLFFQLHDPTTIDRQGNDVGPQYRSVIFCHDDAQRAAAEAAIERWRSHFDAPIVTEVTAAGTFWPAEDYHQDYWRKNPRSSYCNALIPPKLKKLGLK